MLLNKKLAAVIAVVALAAGIAAVAAAATPGAGTDRQGQGDLGGEMPIPQGATSPPPQQEMPDSSLDAPIPPPTDSPDPEPAAPPREPAPVPHVPATNPEREPSIAAADVFTAIDDPDLPSLRVSDLRVEKVAQGFSAPTSMAFVDERNLIVLQKNDGQVRLVSNGTLASKPLATFMVENASERGLLGVATNGRDVFVYVTERNEQGEVRHRVYRFTWHGGSLADKTTILDLPGTPGPNHDGGKMVLGPDGMLYIVIGDLNRNGVLQNFQEGPPPDDTSVILKVDRDGNPAANVLAGLPSYYAYGIRNSFGLAFDPATGTLWDTENGPEGYDEINVVRPGFNSGWERVMGPMARTQSTEADLVQLEGSHYADPATSLRDAVGITDLAFAEEGLGSYAGGIFVGDINGGTLYYFRVNAERDGLVLEGEGLADGVVDGGGEAGAITMGAGFGGITDIESGPDGNLYVLSYEGDVYRIRAVQ